MKRWNRAIVALALAVPMAALAHPVAATAQAVTPADLVGTWVRTFWQWDRPDSQYVAEHIWTFRADSTWTVRTRRNGVEDTTLLSKWPYPYKVATSSRPSKPIWNGYWRLQGDTLRYFDSGRHPAESNDLVSRQGDLLVLDHFGMCADTLRRVDESKPLPPPVTTPRPITIDRNALVGTWVYSDSVVLGDKGGRTSLNVHTYTMVLGADSTSSLTQTDSMDAKETTRHIDAGTWGLYPGNVLTVHRKGDPTEKLYNSAILLKDGQLLSTCHRPNAKGFKRTSP